MKPTVLLLRFFTGIMVVVHDTCDNNLRKEMKILVKIWFLLSIWHDEASILQVKAGKATVEK